MGSDQDHLNLGAWMPRSTANGPGERFVLWLQGCPLRCPGCINPELWPFVERTVVGVEEMAGRILATRGIEGVTYTGGEPTVQARALALLSERLRPAGLTVVCYSGYTLEQLKARSDEWIERLLASVDVMIDGPYVQELAAPLLWRGSTNQRVRFLSPAYRRLAEFVDSGPGQVEFSIDKDSFTATGMWPPGLLERLEDLLRG
jgi:anaerobic ribonucleoside-triphosphate reductase activating protein